MTENYHSMKREGSRGSEINFPTMHFTGAIKEVIMTMTGMDANETTMDEESLMKFKPQISGVVILAGQRSMMVSLVLSTAMAASMVSIMTGSRCEDLKEEEICDGISELVHMIAGAAKARLKSWNYNLVSFSPFTITGNNHRVIHRKNAAHFTKWYRVGDNYMALLVHFI